MNRQKLSQDTTINSWLRHGLIAGACILAAIALIIPSGSEDEDVRKLTMERQKLIQLYPTAPRYSREFSESQYVSKRKSWEKRMLQLRRQKDSTHPDMKIAVEVIPLLLRAEDVERRILSLGPEQSENSQSLAKELSQLEMELYIIEHTTH